MDEDFRADWTPEMEQAEAAVRQAAPMVASMVRELKAQGLGSYEAASAAAAWYVMTSHEG